jgi:V8-like Glu-specific endopeptidase
VLPIIGGTMSLNDPQVFALGTSTGMFCTSTLIGPRTLLTAAHCIDASPVMEASNQIDVKAWPGDSITVVRTRTHPKWTGANLEYDVGLVLLASAPAVTPKQWNRAPLSMQTTPEVRAVGFGETHQDGYGIRYEASVPVFSVSGATLYIGNSSSPTTCFGDSGGPSFHTGADGVERVVGIHSFALSEECTGGGDMRVDVVADFIDAWTQEVAPTCATDGACVADCPQPDLDCNCVADGVCRADCPLPDTDSDCPRYCLADGICAWGTCGIPDSDCLHDGDPCANSDLCTGHQCLSDAQHEQYCSRVCRSDSECQADMRCSFGVCRYPVLPVAQMGDACELGRTHCAGGVCAGQSLLATTCHHSCDAQDQCFGGEQCVVGVSAVRYCQGTAVLPAIAVDHPSAPHRCDASGLIPLTWLAALLLARRRSPWSARARTR